MSTRTVRKKTRAKNCDLRFASSWCVQIAFDITRPLDLASWTEFCCRRRCVVFPPHGRSFLCFVRFYSKWCVRYRPTARPRQLDRILSAGEVVLCFLLTEEVFLALCDSIRNGALDFARPPTGLASPAGRDSVAGEVVLCFLLTEEVFFALCDSIRNGALDFAPTAGAMYFTETFHAPMV